MTEFSSLPHQVERENLPGGLPDGVTDVFRAYGDSHIVYVHFVIGEGVVGRTELSVDCRTCGFKRGPVWVDQNTPSGESLFGSVVVPAWNEMRIAASNHVEQNRR
jgi:hypothetical protein